MWSAATAEPQEVSSEAKRCLIGAEYAFGAVAGKPLHQQKTFS
jgi:hypothetical protein